MKKTLLLAAVLGFSVSGVYACPYQKSVEAKDKMTVASVDQKSMSTTDQTKTGSINSDASEPVEN
jgi:hypothetical protein